MTPQEAQMLQDLVGKVEQTELTEKDPDAEALLKDGLGRDPDAIYKLAQTVLIQNLALDQARAQIDQLRQQAAAAASHPSRATSFLGGLLGHRDPAPPPPPPPQFAPPPPQYQAAPQYQAPPPGYYPPAPGGYSAGPGGYPPPPGGGGSFLRSAATTAAGVAAGALAFEGIESLMHGGFGGGPGFGGGYGGPGMPGGGETVINNYYDNPSDQFAQHHEQEAAYDDRANGPDMQPQGPYDTDGPDMQPQGPFHSASDSGGGARLEDASYDPSGDFDDQQMDDNFGDDGSGGGGFDDDSSLV